jgi:hypothetical protein
MEKYKNYLAGNLIAFMAVVLAAILMINLSNFSVEVGSYLYLPIGAKILVFLIFGRYVLPGVILACLFCGFVLFASWGGQLVWGGIGAIMGAITPLVSMWLIEYFKLADYSNLERINFRHILFLIIFTAVLHALGRFLIYAKSSVFTINPVDFLGHYLIGDILGGIVVIWTVLKIIPLVLTTVKA